jgi:septum formation protein
VFILASASPSRLRLLQQAGINPHVVVSGVDEEALVRELGEPSPDQVASTLARAKARAVADSITGPALILGCDSVFEFDGQSFGKPRDRTEAWERWERMQGRSGILHTGHCVVSTTGRTVAALVSTTVHMAQASQEEIEHYLDSGEPMQVAGGFTLDGLGAPFIERIEGDPGNVIGVSLPAIRRLGHELGLSWPDVIALSRQG